MEIITKEFYKVGGYEYDDKELAERLDKLLKQRPGSKICPACKGTQMILVNDWKHGQDENGYPSGIIISTNKKRCTTCKTGVLTPKIIETWE